MLEEAQDRLITLLRQVSNPTVRAVHVSLFAALLAGEPGAEDRFKLSDGRCSYMGYSTDGAGKVMDDVIDMEDDMLPFKWNEHWYTDGGTVSTYWEDTSFATEGMEAITLKISKTTVQA